MSVVGSIIAVLLMLSLLTIVHEWGHYIAARLFKVKVNEFSIFMGPKLFSRVGKKTGTTFSVRCLPIGGFCALEGEEETENSPESFSNKPRYQRAIILCAGVFMNFLLAVLLVTVMFAVNGYDTRKISSVTSVLPMPMEMTAAEPGDEVVAYNGHHLTTPTDYTLYTYVQETEDATLTIRRGNGSKETYLFDRTLDVAENTDGDAAHPGTIRTRVDLYRITGTGDKIPYGTYTSFWDNNQALTVTQSFADGRTVTTFLGEKDGEKGFYVTETAQDGTAVTTRKTGFSAYYSDSEYIEALITQYNSASMFKKFGFSFTTAEQGNIFQCIGHSFRYVWSLIKSVFLSLWWLITGQLGMNALSGPIGITSLVNDVISLDAATSLKAWTLLDMTALISANLAVFNLLPIPGLDGGKLLFIGIELLRGGKKIPPEKEGVISMIFFGLLILLAVVIAGNDIFNLIKG